MARKTHSLSTLIPSSYRLKWYAPTKESSNNGIAMIVVFAIVFFAILWLQPIIIPSLTQSSFLLVIEAIIAGLLSVKILKRR